jgi:hypothetical protein
MMLFFRVLLLWMIGALAFLQVARAQTMDPRLALVASSPFRMILRPTPDALDFAAIQVVEDSIASTLFLFQEGSKYIDVEVVIQQVELVQLEENSLPSTRLRFFCLVTVLAEISGAGVARSTEQRSNLDALIQEAFNDSSGGKSRFQDLLESSQDPMVQDISDVVVAPILPASTTADVKKSAKKLSILDIILIAVSASIFVGIMYMIIQHHRDRGYIENQRIRTFNAPVRHTDDNSKGRLMVSDVSSDSKGFNTTGSVTEESRDQAPSTPSTTNSVDIEFNVNSETPDRIRPTVVTAMTQDALVSTSSLDGSAVKTLSETFESKWFNHKPDTSSLDEIELSSSNSGLSNSSGYSSSSSEDVFQVGSHATASKSSEQDDQSKASSTVSAVSEWMKTICVVPSDTKTSIMTHSSLGQSSTGTQPSVTMSSLGQIYSLEQRSLEQSLASSSLGSDFESREGAEPLEKMEV